MVERLMLDYIPQMLILVDPGSLKILVANHVVEQTLCYSQKQLMSMKITDIESSLQDVFYWGDVGNGQCAEIEAQEGQYLCADASLITVSKSVRVLQHEERTLMLVQAHDIRRERRIEDALEHTLSQLRATLESTGNGILVLDWHGRIKSMNRLFSKMWGIPGDLLSSDDDPAILDCLAQNVVESDLCQLRLLEVVDGSETEDLFTLKDGRVFECRSRPQYLGERIIGRVYGFNDITERQRAQAALEESRNQLEVRVLERTADLQRANETLHMEKSRQEELIRKLGQAKSQLLQSEKMASIGVLAAGVAHEINNPVGFVNSNLGTLQNYIQNMLKVLDAYQEAESSLPSAVRAGIERLKADVDISYVLEDVTNLLHESLDGLQRVKRIVQDLKDFSHVDESERQWASLEVGLDSTLNVVWNELKYKAEVVKEYGNIPQISCFPSQLNQVFMNLLINAGHAIAEHGRIVIRTGHNEKNVWVEVEDSGKGIAPENMARIFEPFFTTKPVGKGTGLGLSLSYGIVQKHHGRIDVSSEVGKGTVFRVTLPKEQGQVNAGGAAN